MGDRIGRQEIEVELFKILRSTHGVIEFLQRGSFLYVLCAFCNLGSTYRAARFLHERVFSLYALCVFFMNFKNGNQVIFRPDRQQDLAATPTSKNHFPRPVSNRITR
jgi:hypothetical protein